MPGSGAPRRPYPDSAAGSVLQRQCRCWSTWRRPCLAACLPRGCVCAHACVCIYGYIYICIICTYIYTYIVYESVFIHTYIITPTSLLVRMAPPTLLLACQKSVGVFVRVCERECVCMYGYIYICIYIYVCVYIHILYTRVYVFIRIL